MIKDWKLLKRFIKRFIAKRFRSTNYLRNYSFKRSDRELKNFSHTTSRSFKQTIQQRNTFVLKTRD
jgi:hypothetical protein